MRSRTKRLMDYDGPELTGDRKLKVWVSQPVFEALSRVAYEHDVLRPVMARRIFFVHLFGRVQLKKLDDAKANRVSGILFSRSMGQAVGVPPREPKLLLGKKTEDALIQLSTDLHEGLGNAAEKVGLPVGAYASHVLCWAMFGRSIHAALALKVTQGTWLDEQDAEAGDALLS